MFFPSGDKFDPFDAFRKCKAFEREKFHILALANTAVTRIKVACWFTAMADFKILSARSLPLALFIFVNYRLCNRSVRWWLLSFVSFTYTLFLAWVTFVERNRMFGIHYNCQRLEQKIVAGEKSAILRCIIYSVFNESEFFEISRVLPAFDFVSVLIWLQKIFWRNFPPAVCLDLARIARGFSSPNNSVSLIDRSRINTTYICEITYN